MYRKDINKRVNKNNKLSPSQTHFSMRNSRYQKAVPTNMPKQTKNLGFGRQLADCPFYHFKYELDSLPLDPAKAFIIEKMCKYKDVSLLQHIY